MHYKVFNPAENYILLDFGNKIDEKLNKYVIALAECIKHKAIIEIIPAYSNLLIEYDSNEIGVKALKTYLKRLRPVISETQGKIIEIPVVYGGEYGPDLSFVARRNGISEEEVISLHSSIIYRVYMLGFLPGFCYLGGMDSRISCERLEMPRLKIPKGSVGIAGMQTGIYPEASPGGWRLIGRTAFELFRPQEIEPFPIHAGDNVKFTPISREDAKWI